MAPALWKWRFLSLSGGRGWWLTHTRVVITEPVDGSHAPPLTTLLSTWILSGCHLKGCTLLCGGGRLAFQGSILVGDLILHANFLRPGPSPRRSSFWRSGSGRCPSPTLSACAAPPSHLRPRCHAVSPSYALASGGGSLSFPLFFARDNFAVVGVAGRLGAFSHLLHTPLPTSSVHFSFLCTYLGRACPHHSAGSRRPIEPPYVHPVTFGCPSIALWWGVFFPPFSSWQETTSWWRLTLASGASHCFLLGSSLGWPLMTSPLASSELACNSCLLYPSPPGPSPFISTLFGLCYVLCIDLGVYRDSGFLFLCACPIGCFRAPRILVSPPSP